MKEQKMLCPPEDWEDVFSFQILTRGKAYHNAGAVRKLSFEGQTCTAYVEGSTLYRVQITVTKKGTFSGSCNCPFARDGHWCKHMAAVLYKWDQETGRTKKQEDALFPADEQEARLYYKLSEMTDCMDFKPRAVKEAKKLLAEGTLRLDEEDVQFFYRQYGGGQVGEAVFRCQASARSCYEAQVRMRFDKERIDFIRCDVCGSYYMWEYYSSRKKTVCSHQIAALLLLKEYLERYNPGDDTDYTGKCFLNLVRKQTATDSSQAEQEKTAVISLVPKLTEDTDTFLSFQIGKDKLYVVKNLTALMDAVHEEQMFPLGKKQTLDFSSETFTKEAEAYFRLIEQAVGQVDALNSRHHDSYQDEKEIRSWINLRGVDLDMFYELAAGTTVPAKRKLSAQNAVRVRPAAVQVHLRVKPEFGRNHLMTGIEITGDSPAFVPGGRFQYAWTEESFGRVDPENVRQLAVVRQLTGGRNLRMHIGLKHLNEFFYRTLPKLEENPFLTVTVSNEELIRKQLSADAEFVFYVDADAKTISCRAEVTYEGKTFPLRLLKKEDYPLPDFRDPKREMEAFMALAGIFPYYDEADQVSWTEREEETVFELLTGGLKPLQEIGEVQVSEAFQRLKIRTTPPVSIGVSIESDLLNLEIMTQDMSTAELMDLLESYRKKRRFHRLANGDYVRLEENESLEMLEKMIDDLGISAKDFAKGRLRLPVYRALYLNEMLLAHNEIASDRDRNFKQIIKNIDTVKDADYELPESLKPVLRNYQKYGYEWLRTLSDIGFGGILADDMGLGKTLQMIAVLYAEKLERTEPATSLVVCPASLVYNWEEEFHKFAPSMKVACVAGTAAHRAQIVERYADVDVLITSYDLLKRDLDFYEPVPFLYQILDEAQYIKNQKAVVAKSVRVINSKKRFALTGTPIENRLEELWSIFDFLMPGFLYSYQTFRKKFEVPIVKEQDEAASARLKQMVSPFILRRKKEDVLKDLPDKIEEIRYARFEKEQQTLYDAQVARTLEMLGKSAEDSGKEKIRILAELTRLRQICCDPSLLFENYRGESAKRQACMELIGSAVDGGHKMLVFSQFTSMLALLEEDLAGQKIAYYKITGETAKEERLRLVRSFNENEVPVFLISLKAGGTGLNLTGADVVIHYDPWWNMAVQNQATDRVHRIGQEKQVSVFRLIARGTIEEKIVKLQEAKKDLADAILSGESKSIGQLSKEELTELLS